MSKLTVTIPYYKNNEQLRRCLLYLNKQTLKNIPVIIINDNETDTADYHSFNNVYENLHLSFVKNKKNLGAMANMLYSIQYPSDSEYTLSLHQDDALATLDYLEKSIEILEQNPLVSFVIGKPIWFREKIPNSLLKPQSGDYYIGDAQDFVNLILHGIHLMFGSVVYRNSVTKNKNLNMERYFTLSDRPFLLSLIESEKQFALYNDPVIFQFSHEAEDTRSIGLKPIHLFNLYSDYKLYTANTSLFLKIATNDILFNYIWFKHVISFMLYIRQAHQLELFKISKIRLKGLLSIPFYFISIANFYKIKNFMQKITQ